MVGSATLRIELSIVMIDERHAEDGQRVPATLVGLLRAEHPRPPAPATPLLVLTVRLTTLPGGASDVANRDPEATKARILAAARARVLGQGHLRRPRRRHRGPGARQQADALLLLRVEGRALPRDPPPPARRTLGEPEQPRRRPTRSDWPSAPRASSARTSTRASRCGRRSRPTPTTRSTRSCAARSTPGGSRRSRRSSAPAVSPPTSTPRNSCSARSASPWARSCSPSSRSW